MQQWQLYTVEWRFQVNGLELEWKVCVFYFAVCRACIGCGDACWKEGGKESVVAERKLGPKVVKKREIATQE